MMYYLAHSFLEWCSVFNVVHYVSVRAIAGLMSTFFCCLIFGSRFIDVSAALFRAQVRELTPESHKSKDNMPTMGGVFIVAVVMLNIFVWCAFVHTHVAAVLLTLCSFGAIGLWDDMGKIMHKKGISARHKFSMQLIASFGISLFLYTHALSATTVTIPFFKNVSPDIGIWYIPWTMFIIIALSNAVNLTDGLDGLAIGSLICNFATFALIAYCAGHYIIADYLHIPFAGSSEIVVVAAILMGASLGFLWYNAYPAQIFMGDVGSLALGAVLAVIGILSRQELLLPIAGVLFVIEVSSVIIQVLSYRLFKKRFFRMAPIHHHFELLGWQEAKITVRFGIITFLACLCALLTLKIR